jgi:large subunit ribosomal protein L10
MPTAEKEKSIEQAKEWYSKSSGVVFTDYRGLKVKELQALRSDLRKKGAEIHVLKNTLFRLAAGDDAPKLADELHNGTTAFAFVFENEAEIAKTLLEYARTSRKLIVKGGFFGGKSFTAQQVEQLSQLPSREVLLSQVIGAIAAPLTTLIGTIEALYADPIRTIGAVADKVAEGSPIAEAAPLVAEAPTADTAPVAEAAPVAESAPAAEEAPEAAPVSEALPVAEEAPVAGAAPSAEAAPTEEAAPAAEEAPAAEAPAEEAPAAGEPPAAE